jgi:hypothetical protein
LKENIVLFFFVALFLIINNPGAASDNRETTDDFNSKGLFMEVQVPQSKHRMGKPWVKRQRFVTIRENWLAVKENPKTKEIPIPGKILYLNLFKDTFFISEISEKNKNDSGSITLLGRIKRIADGQFILVIYERKIEGLIFTPEKSIQILPCGDKLHQIQEVDTGYPLLPQDDFRLVHINEDQKVNKNYLKKDIEPFIDVMVVFTPKSLEEVGGLESLIPRIDFYFAFTNQSYKNSGIIQQIRLVHIEELDFDETEHDFLAVLKNPNDGIIDNVHTLRDRYGADIVVGIQHTGVSGPSGLAYVNCDWAQNFAPFAFATTRPYAVIAGGIVFSHELGHLMGGLHDCNVSGASPNPFCFDEHGQRIAYNHGRSLPGLWSTIMAAGNVIPYFSNPDRFYEGIRMGVPEGEYCAEDNRKVFNSTAHITANFRTSNSPFIQVTSPNGEEALIGNNKYSVKWESRGNIGPVKIEYSSGFYEHDDREWITIASDALNDGMFQWTVPNESLEKVRIRITGNGGFPRDMSDHYFTIYEENSLIILLNRDELYFGAATDFSTPSHFFIDASGTGDLDWSVSADQPWVKCYPVSGTGAGDVTVSVDTTGLSAGTYAGNITVADPHAANSPQTVAVILNVYKNDQTSPSFGHFATPIDEITAAGSIPVTGWALDDIGVKDVGIYRGETNNLIYIGKAVFVEGARPDIEAAYPGYPLNYKAGWGYMMLTNFLPNGGNGKFKIHAVATDAEGNQTILGTRTIYCDNTNAVKPFGTIDTPTQGGHASGRSFINWGWVLTPQPNQIPIDGSTINVYVDGLKVGNPTYNKYREDIAALFPGYANSNGAVGMFYLDTTEYENGVHTIQWTATDNAGNTDGIGSRYFMIQNLESSTQLSGSKGHKAPSPGPQALDLLSLSTAQSSNQGTPLKIGIGFDPENLPQILHPDKKGIFHLQIPELERIEIQVGVPGKHLVGYLVVGNRLRNLPVGSTLDKRTGKFNWMPGPGFLKKYKLVFFEKLSRGEITRKTVLIEIIPKFLH